MALIDPDIRRQAELVLRLPAKERVRFLLETPKPMALVRALPDGEFHLTVREVGPEDALPLMALASSSQVAHLLDLEGWRKDRFDALRCGAWVALLVESGESTVKRFVRGADDETLILLFRLWANVRPLDIDHEEPTRGHGVTEAGDERGLVSPDGANLFSPERSEHALAARRLAECLYVDDRDRYLGIIRSAVFELPSEVEESALQWRASRLDEHGYPRWDDAQSIYAPKATSGNPSLPPKTSQPEVSDAMPAPRAALRVLGPETLLHAAIDALPPSDREVVLFGLTALVNRVLVADGGDAGSMDAHARAIERAGSYVGLALERRRAEGGSAGAAVLREVSAVDLFREGYALAAALKNRAQSMLKTGWGGGHPRAGELIDAPLLGRVSGLLQPRPLYVALDDDPTSAAARDFRTMPEIDETEVTIELCEALGSTLLERRGVTASGLLAEDRRPFEETPRFSTLLLTALTWHAVRGELRIDRLPSDVVADFLRTTASRRTADPAAPARAMSSLVEALVVEGGLGRRSAAALRAFGASCLLRLAADCGGLDPGTPVTPRVVGCLRLA